ncbi:TPA: type IV pilin [Candidatus Bathyarchaeota archaeon]|nr:type IV pilin [Candidatus Bathyarchaeota archaeon]
MNKSIIAEKRALSPVIATVILISVTIVVAVSVAYWMGSIAGGYTTFEQVELPTAYAEYGTSFDIQDDGVADDSGWKITIELKNTGSADATIDNIFINAVPLSSINTAAADLWYKDNGVLTEATDFSSISVRVNKGSTNTIIIYIIDDGGQSVKALLQEQEWTSSFTVLAAETIPHR